MSLLLLQRQQRAAAGPAARGRGGQHMPLTLRATPRAPLPTPSASASRARPIHHHPRRHHLRTSAASTTAPTTPTSPATTLPDEVDVVIVGAGLAGLAAARALLRQQQQPASSSSQQPLRVVILEASDGVGGRARTDVHPDGFLLDRGFQIFLTGYPEAKDVLDYDALDLRPFYAGALVRFSGSWHRVADPFRHPLDGLLSLLPSNAVGTPLDKVNVGVFRLKCVLGGSLEALLSAVPERATRDRLAAEGFSESIVDRFFRPFLGGIFFDRSLGVSDRLFAFVMRMLATGSNCLPAKGIGAMGEQLAGGLPAGVVRLGARVEGIEGGEGGSGARVRVRVGSDKSAVVTARKAVIVASEGPEARRLVDGALGAGEGAASSSSSLGPASSSPAVGTACLYFDAPPQTLPSQEAILYLNGGLSGPQDQALVNNCCFPSTVASTYAPPGRALVSVSTIGTRPELDDAALEGGVRRELSEWFGQSSVGQWRHLRTYRIPYAQPPQSPPTDLRKSVRVGAIGEVSLLVCGDHRDTATFDGALLSGRRAAEAVLADVRAKASTR
jgi:phytoene dehydrogenase-like protein